MKNAKSKTNFRKKKNLQTNVTGIWSVLIK